MLHKHINNKQQCNKLKKFFDHELHLHISFAKLSNNKIIIVLSDFNATIYSDPISYFSRVTEKIKKFCSKMK